MRRTFASADEARTLERALAPDQGDFVRWERDGATLTFVVEADSAASARTTVEDLLACLGSAERARGISPARRADRGGDGRAPG